MKFRLIVDPTAEESVVVTVGRPSALSGAIEDLVRSDAGEDRIALWDGEDRLFFTYPEIELLSVADRKLYAVARDGRRYRVKGSLSELEGLLPSYFIRINKSAIVNERCIVRFVATFHGGIDAYLRCGCREYISRRCYAEIKRRLKK